MIFALLGLISCAEVTLCIKKTANCPEGATEDKTINLETADSLIKNNIYRIVTDSDALKIEESNMPYIVAITGYGATAAACSIEITKELKIEKPILLENVGVTVDGSATNLNVVINELTANKDGKLIKGTKNAPVITITKLIANTMSSAKDNIVDAKSAFIKDYDAICQVTAKIDKVELVSCTDVPVTIEVPKTCLTLEIISIVTLDKKTLVFDTSFAQVVTVTTINLTYGNRRKTVMTIDELKSLEDSQGKLTVYVNTYYQKLANQLTGSAKYSIILNEDFEFERNKRSKLPRSKIYCLSESVTFSDEECYEGSQLLWDVNELKRKNNISVSLVGYLESENKALSLKLEEFIYDKLLFTGLKKQQTIAFTISSKEIDIYGELKFNNINFKAVFENGITEAKVSFKNISLVKTKMSSNKLRATAIKVKSEDVISDPSSFRDCNVEKPTKSFTVIDVNEAKFDGSGKKVVIDGIDFTDASIPVPFTIQASSESTQAKLSLAKNGESAGKALPFKFNVMDGAVLNVEFDGDWSANEIAVNVEEGSNYKGTLAANAKAPVLHKTGSGEATLGDKEIIGEGTKDPSTLKNELSGGAVAGIVIAVVVAVSAIVASVVVVIKKKK